MRIAKMTKKAVVEAVEIRHMDVELHIDRNETAPVKKPGVVGICETKKGNLMVYMVNKDGKMYNTSVHTSRRVANGRVMERILALANA